MGEEVWWCGVTGTIFSLGFLKIVPAISNKGVYLETPTALTAAEKC